MELVQLISEEKVIIPPTDGREFIASSKDVFTGNIDDRLKAPSADQVFTPTKETKCDVYMMIKERKIEEVFRSFSRNLDSLCFTQSQIVEFARLHWKWIRTNGFALCMLFKMDDKYLVAVLFAFSDWKVSINAVDLSIDEAWESDNRVVVPD